jgi:hypothetical protein
VKPAVGFTLPSAGVTPAPSIKRRCGTSSLLEVGSSDLSFASGSCRVWFPFPLGKGLGVRLPASFAIRRDRVTKIDLEVSDERLTILG